MEEKKVVEKTIGEIDGILNGISISDTKLKDITIRIGGRILKYEQISNSDYSLDKEIREEYNVLLTEKMRRIRDVINEKFNETLQVLQMAKDEFIRKENILLDKLKKSSPMPDVTMNHARKGLSIIKGDRNGEIHWLVRRTYAPKTVTTANNTTGDFSKSVFIKPAFAIKLVTPIFIMVTTIDNKVASVSTRKVGGLELFSHYHQANPDCWGRWKYNTTWSTPDDIIGIADEASSVLENINMGSIAKHEPLGLPSTTLLKRNLLDDEKKIDEIKPEVYVEQSVRTGNTQTEDIWSI